MASWPQPPSDALCLWQRSMACLTPKCLTLHTMPRLVSRRSPSPKIDRPQQWKPQSWSTRGPLCSTDTLPSDFVQGPQALSRSRNQDTPNRPPGTAPNRRRQSKAFLEFLLTHFTHSAGRFADCPPPQPHACQSSSPTIVSMGLASRWPGRSSLPESPRALPFTTQQSPIASAYVQTVPSCNGSTHRRLV